MSIIGITGSIASGKTTVAHLMAGKKYPLFSADIIVSNLYKKKTFIKILVKKFKLSHNKKIKDQIKLILSKNEKNLYKLESIIHPFVKKEMIIFLKRKSKLLFLTEYDISLGGMFVNISGSKWTIVMLFFILVFILVCKNSIEKIDSFSFDYKTILLSYISIIFSPPGYAMALSQIITYMFNEMSFILNPNGLKFPAVIINKIKKHKVNLLNINVSAFRILKGYIDHNKTKFKIR